ncbi:MAG: hypothetical protein NTW12_15440 [Deltaproteobacteria bacterium]|nr:hypothetical protein [Deltaproteobacteria bacterium]
MPRENMETTQRPDLSELLRELPPFVSRKHPRFKELTGYSPRSLANMDSLGMTKAVKKIMLGGAVAYQRESLVAWLEERSRVIG